MTAALDRVLAVTPRAAEYFSIKELQAQTGQPADNFTCVVLKELVDNAIDAAEVAGRAPVVEIVVDHVDDANVISVDDNGPGLPAKTLESVLDFNVRASTNSAYRAPTRGLQGNALKTILGIPFAMGSAAPVIIESSGRRHAIRMSLDPSGHVRTDHQIESSDVTEGTRIVVTLPAAGQTFSADYWALAFGTLNPHATVKITCFENGSSPDKKSAIIHKTVDFSNGWRKYVPGDLTAPAWYSVEDMQRLVFAHINAGHALTLREFVRQFRGLTGTGKQKLIAEQFPGIATLSDFEKDPDQVADLLAAMKDAAMPPKPSILGHVGADHFRICFDKHGLKESRFWHKKIEGLADGNPFVVEAAVGEVQTGALYQGINFSPCFDDPIANTRISGPKVSATGLRSYLYNAHCDPFPMDQGHEAAIAFHIVCPALQFLDRGKTRLANLPAPVVDAISKVLWSVTKTLYADEERRRKDAAQQERRDIAGRAEAKPVETTLKDAVFWVMQAAVDGATGNDAYPTSARHLYYNVRRRIQKYTSKELKDNKYFRPLLNEYQAEFGPIKGLYYAPRGTLYEPHTRNSILVGTREIASYSFEDWHFDKILYAEKDGIWPILDASGLLEKYDMAVLVGQGYATEAARMLFQRADKDRNYKLFVLHDADPHGYNIARTLREETTRMPGYSVDVIGLGLTVADALELEMEEETFTRKKALPSALGLTDLEHEYFTGRQVSRKQWIGKRFELDTMTSPQLIEYIESKLIEHGAATKVIPPEKVVLDELSDQYTAGLEKAIEDEIMGRLDVQSMVIAAMEQVPAPAFDADEVSKGLADLPAISWRDVVKSIVREHVSRSLDAVNFDEV